MTVDQIIYLKFKQFSLNLIIDSINRRFIIYEKFDAIHQKIDQKINVFKIYLKEIKRKLSFFDKYYKIILFLAKLISMLKNKFFIMKNVFNIKKIILFKIIMQKITLSCTRENNDNHNFQQKTTNFSNINLNEINNLINLDILIILKKIINQKIILMRKRKTSARMRK